jgi:hypothetical protein
VISIKDTGTPLMATDIARLEHEIAGSLPEEYKRFLLANNGGVPEGLASIEIEGLPGSPTDIQEFFGLGLEIETNNIDWYLREIPERLPANSIPIAIDSGGGLFCLSYRGREMGQVTFKDLEGPDPGVYPVAESFNYFLAKIRPV